MEDEGESSVSARRGQANVPNLKGRTCGFRSARAGRQKLGPERIRSRARGPPEPFDFAGDRGLAALAAAAKVDGATAGQRLLRLDHERGGVGESSHLLEDAGDARDGAPGPVPRGSHGGGPRGRLGGWLFAGGA